MNINIKHKYSALILWTGDAETLRDGVELAVKSGANLIRVDLIGVPFIQSMAA